MKIFVCIRQALDWSTSTKDFRIDPRTNEVSVTFPRYRIDQFDEIALELALRVRESSGAEVWALTVGTQEDDEVLRHAFAMRSDRATLIERTGSEISTPELLAAGVRYYGGGIVLCGRVGSENGSGRTGPMLAELLGVPFVANTVHIERCSGEFVCRCEADLGYQTLQVPGPFVATVTNAAMNLPRVPGMRDRVMGHRMSIETVSAGMLSSHLAQSRLPSVRVQRRYVPRLSRVCHRLEGSPREQAVAIARFVRRSVEQT